MRKMKFLKKVTAIALALGMLTIPNLSLAATETSNDDTTGTQIQPRWTYINCCMSGLHLVDGPNKIISVSCSTDTYNPGAGTSAELEWYNPDTRKWQEVPDMYWGGYSTLERFYDIDEDNVKVPNSGKYRALISHYAVDSNGEVLEATSEYTNIVTVP